MDILIRELAILSSVAGIWCVYFIQKYVFGEERTKKHVKILLICSGTILLIGLVTHDVAVGASFLIILIQGVLFRKKRRLLGIL